jgi:hypothetical protein
MSEREIVALLVKVDSGFAADIGGDPGRDRVAPSCRFACRGARASHRCGCHSAKYRSDHHALFTGSMEQADLRPQADLEKVWPRRHAAGCRLCESCFAPGLIAYDQPSADKQSDEQRAGAIMGQSSAADAVYCCRWRRKRGL